MKFSSRKVYLIIGLLFTLGVILSVSSIFNTVWSTTQESNPAENNSETNSFSTSDQYTLRVGQELFKNYCQVCHGDTGEGNGFNAYMLSTKPRNFSDGDYMNALSDNRLAEAIREGGRGVNKSVLMPAWGNTFSPFEISYLVEYIRTFVQKTSEVDSSSLQR